MELLLDVVSGMCLAVGSVFALIGGIGLLRLPDFFCRIHGGGITDTMGAGLVLLGLMLHTWTGFPGADVQFQFLVTVKLLMILFFLLVSSSTSAHALARAATAHGLDPNGGGGPSTP